MSAELKAAYDAGSVILALYDFNDLPIVFPIAFVENEQASALVARFTMQSASDITGVHFLTITLMNASVMVYGSVEEYICENASK